MRDNFNEGKVGLTDILNSVRYLMHDWATGL